MVDRADVSIPEITAFEAVAQTGSFTKAAEALGTGKSNVGKIVQRLEERLDIGCARNRAGSRH
ncbi:LysR family transcriptional regulator [Paraburkholderia sp. USG1]|uniref:helix-turn-helix domain-containing protein n=1 Tax=Paraburkholderia sp. USG1 TaxID=2952268 RepID=UPI002870858A|nr:LysR family transcriptional regulator [Paraburkholderia sp. USG1]